MNKYKSFYIFCFVTIILTGCWDVVNIEERGFIVGSAIDIEEEDSKHPEFTITNQMVLPAGMIPAAAGGSGEEIAFLNYTSKGKSIYQMEEEIAAISSKVPYYEHLTILVVSEDVAKKEHLFSNLLDTYIRDVNLRRGIKVVVSKEKAKELLNFTTPNDKLPAMHIEELLEKSSDQLGFLKPRVVGDIEEDHLREKSYVLPYLDIKEYLEYKYGAVFHGPKDKMVGILNDDEMNGLEMIEGVHTTKIIEFPYKGRTFALKTIRSNSNLSVDPKDINNINVTIDIEVEGVIKEAFSNTDFRKPSEIKEVQKAVSNEVKKYIEKSIKKAQEELGADVFNIWQQLETKHYKKWERVKDDWEKGEYYFKKVNFDINVTTEIYGIGTTNKTT